eukprot:415738_1
MTHNLKTNYLQLTSFSPSAEIYSIIAISWILLTFMIAYYSIIIVPKKESIIYRVRRPLFLLYFIIALSCAAILCSVNAILYITDLLFPKCYNILLRVMTYFGTLLWFSIRMWLLFYPYVAAKYQQKILISKMLNDNHDNNHDNNHPHQIPQHDSVSSSSSNANDNIEKHSNSLQYWLYEKKSYIFGDWKVLTKYMSFFLFLWTLINISLDLTLSPTIPIIFMVILIVIVWMLYTVWMLSIWFVNIKYCGCCNDNLYLGLELTMLWLVWVINLVLITIYHSEPIMLCWISLLFQKLNILITILIPCVLSQKIKNTIESNTETSQKKKK